MRATCWFVLGMLGCGPSIDRPQSSTVTKATGAAGSRVDMQVDPQGPRPIARSRLKEIWPQLNRLSAEQIKVMSSALNSTPGQCPACDTLPIAHCGDKHPAEACPVLAKLVRRAQGLVMAGSNPVQVKTAINYPDSWIAEIGSAEGVTVRLYRDRSGPFAEMTEGILSDLKRKFPEGVAFVVFDEEQPTPEALGVRSRPTWFINGHRFRGAQSSGLLARFIALEVQDQSP